MKYFYMVMNFFYMVINFLYMVMKFFYNNSGVQTVIIYLFRGPYSYNVCVFIPVVLFMIKNYLKWAYMGIGFLFLLKN